MFPFPSRIRSFGAASRDGRPLGLSVEPDVFRAPAIIDAVAHQRQPLDVYLDRYLSILGRHRPTAHNFSLIYELPQSLRYMNDARLIGRDSEEGRDFVRSLSATGLSAGLFELGFRDVDHFWPLVCRCYRRKDRSDSICSAAIGPRGGARAGDREGFQRARLRFSGDRWLVAAFRASISRSFLQHGP